MKDYYSILRITEKASLETIKRSYKKLAFMYHPDRNPGNYHAEEEFKLLNEAYQVLSNPQRRAQYDLLVKYSYQTPEYSSTNYTPPYSSEKDIYSRYGRAAWRERPKYAKGPGYKIDKEYFRVQKIILAIFLGMVSFAYLLFIGNQYYKDLKKKRQEQRIVLAIDSVYIQFREGEFDKSIERIIRLENSFINRTPFALIRDSLVSVIKEKAALKFSAHNYHEAIKLLKIVRKYDRYLMISTLEKLSEAYVNSGQDEKAINVYKELLEKDPENVDLYVHIAGLFYKELGDLQNASKYLESAKNIFVKIQKSLYGEAFNLVMSTKNIPESYIDLFILRAQVNYELQNFRKSYSDSSWIVFLSPDKLKGYQYRILSGLKIGRTFTICADILNINNLGGEISADLERKYCS